VPIDRIPYAVDGALKSLAGHQHVVLVGAKPPTAFFGYPGKPSLMAPPDAQTHVLARPDQDAVAALEWLADALGAPAWSGAPDAIERPTVQRGAFHPDAFALTLAALLPDNAIVVEDAVTSGRSLFGHTFGAAANDWLQITGGAIGHGFPCATGAAVACPTRKTVCLQSDGGGMYGLQSLWTQARERLNVVNVVFANRVYKILQGELLAVGAQPGPASNELFDLARPELNWVQLANGMGVEAVRVQSLEGFADAFTAACARPGPFLIEFQI
jgi:acetolactate synthase-1/2/3 large subunit